MQRDISKLLNKVSKHSKSFQDETLLTNIPWVLVEEESVARKVYLLKSQQQELAVYVDGELCQRGKWLVSKTTTYFSLEIEGEVTLFERGFLNDTFMLLEKDDGTYRLFINEEKLKNKEYIPSFEKCLAFIEKNPLGTTEVVEKFDKHGCVLAISIVFLIIGLSSLFLGFLFRGVWGVDSFFFMISIPALLIGVMLLLISQQKK